MSDQSNIPNPLVEKVQMLLADNDYGISAERTIDYGYQIKTTSGAVINMYRTGKILLQGQKDEKLKELFIGGLKRIFAIRR